MLSVNSSSTTFHSILICAFINQAIHFISFYLSLFSVNSSSKFGRAPSTEELTCPCTLAAGLCLVFFPSVLSSDYGTSTWSWLCSCKTLTTVGLIGGICTVWVLVANPQFGDAMLRCLALEIIRRAAVFSLRKIISINVWHSAQMNLWFLKSG